ncbi:uncharacterized protein BT62DRAFT_1003562 [Guyanagaster necrorhizus]|uniref:Uncharacterized protein n=1 Tax=Guyanagaster necrorhizus TaxID=856835 RepID=A0A9P8AUT3_9AGAR|nr:uncharacterized protein BT62DRAFT_1003562 [Guyanagaster necrorhizus MCA 3950]KAG7448834.1 hypothetical protein BT62DRAFT_1003562 [Guyanagaster necrorhizus MCA 3950]
MELGYPSLPQGLALSTDQSTSRPTTNRAFALNTSIAPNPALTAQISVSIPTSTQSFSVDINTYGLPLHNEYANSSALGGMTVWWVPQQLQVQTHQGAQLAPNWSAPLVYSAGLMMPTFRP